MKFFLRLFAVWLLLDCAQVAWSQTAGPKIDRVEVKFVGPATVSEQFVRVNIRVSAGDTYKLSSTQDDVHAPYEPHGEERQAIHEDGLDPVVRALAHRAIVRTERDPLLRVEFRIAETVRVLARRRDLAAHEQERIVRIDAGHPAGEGCIEAAALQDAARTVGREEERRRVVDLVLDDQPHHAVDLVVDVMQPELGGLMGDLEQPLFRMRQLRDVLLQLEQLRFHFQFRVDTDLPADTIEVPHLLFQPIVENAVKHGVSSLRENGLITLSAYARAEDLVVEVTASSGAAVQIVVRAKLAESVLVCGRTATERAAGSGPTTLHIELTRNGSGYLIAGIKR